MIGNIITTFGEYLKTSAGYETVYYAYVPNKGFDLAYPLAEIYTDGASYPLQFNMGASQPITTNVIFKSYFKRENEIGTSAGMMEHSQKESDIYRLFYDVNFNSILALGNEFIMFNEIQPTTSVHTDILGNQNNIIMVDYRFKIVWRMI